MFTHSQQNLVSAKKQIKILLYQKFDFVEQKHCAHYPGTKKIATCAHFSHTETNISIKKNLERNLKKKKYIIELTQNQSSSLDLFGDPLY